MIYIHPFPARMAPDIALKSLEGLKPGQLVLDPMCGSGTVLGAAARVGLRSIGFDLDPLACLVAGVGGTRVIGKELESATEHLIRMARVRARKTTRLPWIDGDLETSNFVEYWFGEKQVRQLRALSYYLVCEPIEVRRSTRNALRVALSRLIITKEPKASLARDTAHSRPHKTIYENEFDLFDALPHSVTHVWKALRVSDIKRNARSYLDDGRRLRRISNNEVDAVVTSPPYLNAIDYLRGHKFSLVWFGYKLSVLRAIRSGVIGAERIGGYADCREYKRVAAKFGFDDLKTRPEGMMRRYFNDLCVQLNETYRVLKPGGMATYVIGNSTIRGKIIRNDRLLQRAAELAGLVCEAETARDIPDHKRYLPIPSCKESALAKRMRTEHVLFFRKPSKSNRLTTKR